VTLHCSSFVGLTAEFTALFPHGWAGADVLGELAPHGLAESPLAGVCHPSPQQQYEEQVRVHRNLANFTAFSRWPLLLLLIAITPPSRSCCTCRSLAPPASRPPTTRWFVNASSPTEIGMRPATVVRWHGVRMTPG